ncbi:MAG: phenylalanine--tRNA ligase subunit beta [Nitritalea sp.]
MKISINQLHTYLHLPETPEQIAALLTGSGLEVEGITRYDAVPGGLEGVVVGEVLTCVPHPNADKLRACTVAIGADMVVPIVCGAPNVAAGQKVLVATVGATLYPAEGDPFTIKKAKIRGEVSEGMICAEDELGLGQSHAGIMVLDTDVANGTPAADYLDMAPDYVLEIGLTPNRADAASHLGVARDLAALLQRALCRPDVASFQEPSGLPVPQVRVEDAADCPRYAGIVLEGIQVGPSPEWLQQFLRKLGLEPINNVVDVTNYVLHDLGQPLHAFDYAKIKGGIEVKKLPAGTTFVTLDEKERTLKGEELMICDARGGLCMAGIFGGAGSGVSEETTSLFLESACFSADVIRRGSLLHGLKTDASFRFERGTDPNLPVYALKRAVLLLQELAGARVASALIDLYPHPVEDLSIPVLFQHVDRLIGVDIPREEIFQILAGLEIGVRDVSDTGFTAVVKPYRVDVTREADVIEEILRIYGFDRVPLSETLDTDFLALHPSKDKQQLQQRLTDLFTSRGFYEIMTNSLTKAEYVEKSGFLDPSQHVVILNKLSEDLDVMRQTLLFSGLEVCAHNINRRQKDLKLLEFGTTYKKVDGVYLEESRLGMWLTGQRHAESWREQGVAVGFEDAHAQVMLVFEKLGVQPSRVEVVHAAPFDYAIRWYIGEQVLGSCGLVSASVAKSAGVKQEVFYVDLSWDLLVKKAKGLKHYQEISKFPEVRRDLSLVLDRSVSFAEVSVLAHKTGGKLLQRLGVFDVYQGDKLPEDKKAYALSFILQDVKQTLTDKVIEKTMQRLMEAFEKELGAVIRK